MAFKSLLAFLLALLLLSSSLEASSRIPKTRRGVRGATEVPFYDELQRSLLLTETKTPKETKLPSETRTPTETKTPKETRAPKVNPRDRLGLKTTPKASTTTEESEGEASDFIWIGTSMGKDQIIVEAMEEGAIEEGEPGSSGMLLLIAGAGVGIALVGAGLGSRYVVATKSQSPVANDSAHAMYGKCLSEEGYNAQIHEFHRSFDMSPLDDEMAHKGLRSVLSADDVEWCNQDLTSKEELQQWHEQWKIINPDTSFELRLTSSSSSGSLDPSSSGCVAPSELESLGTSLADTTCDNQYLYGDQYQAEILSLDMSGRLQRSESIPFSAENSVAAERDDLDDLYSVFDEQEYFNSLLPGPKEPKQEPSTEDGHQEQLKDSEKEQEHVSNEVSKETPDCLSDILEADDEASDSSSSFEGPGEIPSPPSKCCEENSQKSNGESSCPSPSSQLVGGSPDAPPSRARDTAYAAQPRRNPTSSQDDSRQAPVRPPPPPPTWPATSQQQFGRLRASRLRASRAAAIKMRTLRYPKPSPS